MFSHCINYDVDPLELPLRHAALLPLARETLGSRGTLRIVFVRHERDLDRFWLRLGAGGELLLGIRLFRFILLRRTHFRHQFLVLVQFLLQLSRRLEYVKLKSGLKFEYNYNMSLIILRGKDEQTSWPRNAWFSVALGLS